MERSQSKISHWTKSKCLASHFFTDLLGVKHNLEGNVFQICLTSSTNSERLLTFNLFQTRDSYGVREGGGMFVQVLNLNHGDQQAILFPSGPREVGQVTSKRNWICTGHWAAVFLLYWGSPRGNWWMHLGFTTSKQKTQINTVTTKTVYSWNNFSGTWWPKGFH